MKKINITKEQFEAVAHSGLKMSKIVAIEWEKSEAKPMYYKNYKTWGYQSSPTRLMLYFEQENGNITKKDVYQFILNKLGWKKLSDKRYTQFHDMFIGKMVNANYFVA
jgi:hypothetical protein